MEYSIQYTFDAASASSPSSSSCYYCCFLPFSSYASPNDERERKKRNESGRDQDTPLDIRGTSALICVSGRGKPGALSGVAVASLSAFRKD